MRIAMLGTGDFAVPAFQALIDSAHPVVALITQPDRSGRGHHRHVNPMKELAITHGIPVLQPDRVNSPEALARLRELQAELFVVAAYGQILSAELLSIPPRGAINLHASLLPKYRGAAPVQYAVLKGETETGVTIFQIEPKLDAGPILGKVTTTIGPKETSGELEERLALLGAPLAIEVIGQIEAGTTQPVPQVGGEVSRAPKMPKSMGEIDWTRRSVEIGWHVRAMQPWPMPFTFLHTPGTSEGNPHRLLILDVDPVADKDLVTDLKPREFTPGALHVLTEGRLIAGTGDGAVEIVKIQPAGKRAMSAADFLRGTAIPSGSFLGAETAGQ